EVLRKVLELGQTVANREHLLAVVNVHRRLPVEAVDRSCGNVDHAERRMPDEHGASARRAELAMARLGLLDEAELLLALHPADAGGRPRLRRVDRGPEPASTRAAMAERLGGGLAGELHLDRAAEAVALALLSCHRESSVSLV